jgi:hypothetical protein
MPNDAAAEKSSSAEHGDGGTGTASVSPSPHPKAGPAPLGAGSAICFPPRILDAKSPRIGGPDASPRRKPITCHKRNQNRIASESWRMR